MSFELSKKEAESILNEYLDVAREIVKCPFDWVGFEENIQYAKNILKAHYKGRNPHSVISMPLHY